VIKNRVIALAYRITAFLVCLFGILWATNLFSGEFHGVALLYYTIQTNILVLAMFGMLIVKTATTLKNEGKEGENGFFPRLSAGALVAIALTLIVFWLVLAPFMLPEGAGYLKSFSNLSVHLIAPLLMLGDYIMFSKGGALKKTDPYLFMIVPIVYLVKTLIIGFSGAVKFQIPELTEASNFPYFFLDYNDVGGFMFLYIAVMSAFYLGLSFAMLAIDKKRAKRTTNE